MDDFQLIRLAASCLKVLENIGFDVVSSHDFNDLVSFIGDIGKPGLTPKLDPEMNDFLQSSSRWFGLTLNGEPIAIIASLFQDLGTEGLSSFLLRSTNRQYGEGAVISIASQEVVRIKGKTAYLGELYVKEKYRGRRAWLRAYVMMAMASCCLEWNADYCYAFFRERDFIARMPQLYGFSECIPNIMEWGRDIEGRSSNEVLALTSRPGLIHMANMVAKKRIKISDSV